MQNKTTENKKIVGNTTYPSKSKINPSKPADPIKNIKLRYLQTVISDDLPKRKIKEVDLAVIDGFNLANPIKEIKYEVKVRYKEKELFILKAIFEFASSRKTVSDEDLIEYARGSIRPELEKCIAFIAMQSGIISEATAVKRQEK